MRVVTATGFHPTEKMGGAEHQTFLLARGLAELGHEVVFLTTNSDQEGKYTTGRITVIKTPGRRIVGLKEHRQIIEKAIQEIMPDVCYVRVFEDLATIVSLCKHEGIPVVSMSCHAMETSPLLVGYHPRETIGHLRSMNTFLHLRSFLSIRNSTAHVCITNTLQRKIQRWFPRKLMQVIYNGSLVPPLQETHDESSGQVIWVNNLKRFKRPEIFIELARCLPQFRFVIIGRMVNGKYGKKLGKALEQASSNLKYLGPMTIDQANAAIRHSDLLLYTSLPEEGFGNSFTQAWLRQVPTISLSFDPDGIIEREKIGRCSSKFEQLVIDVKQLMEDEPTRRDMGRRAREYAIRHHSVERMVSNYESLFHKILSNSSPESVHELRPV